MGGAASPSMRGSAVAEVAPAPEEALAPDAADGDDLLPPGTMVGEYRIETRLGKGGMGAVYGARHPVIGKRVAIKVISRELSRDRNAVDRFVLEAQSVNQIGHPNIVDIFAFGALPDGRNYFVMEWLGGVTLATRMRDPVPLGEAVAIVDAIARALDAAHKAGVMHRDLKPDNVFLATVRDEPARVKLLDFGLAKLTAADPSASQTRTGIVLGTPLYLSPEQARGVAVDARADVYALGVMLYELTTGTAPFLADSAVEIMAKHIAEPPPPPLDRNSELPEPIAGVVEAMLAKDPAARPSIAYVRATIAPFAGSTALPIVWEPAAVWLASDPASRAGTPYPRTTPTPRGTLAPRVTPSAARSKTVALGRRPKRRRKLIAAVALVAAGAFAAAGIVVAVGRDDAATPPAAAPPPGDAAAIVAAELPDAAGAPAVLVAIDASPAPAPAPADPTTGSIVVTVDPPDAAVEIAGTRVALSSGRGRVELAPGQYDVVVTARNRKPKKRRVRVAAGAEETVVIKLDAGGRPPRDPREPRAGSVDDVQDPFGP